MNIEIVEAYNRIPDVKRLFCEYSASLNIDLCFQNYQDELTGLPGKYSSPEGRLYIALVNKIPIGCIGLRRFDIDRCEMKRLFVSSLYRNMGIGKMLSQKIIADAVTIGYTHMVLDTLSTMSVAISLYKSLGFKETDAYYDNPHREACYFSLDLSSVSSDLSEYNSSIIRLYFER